MTVPAGGLFVRVCCYCLGQHRRGVASDIRARRHPPRGRTTTLPRVTEIVSVVIAVNGERCRQLADV